MEDCIFCDIRDRKIPKEFTYEDRNIMVFPDIHPVRPVHLLVVPKQHIPEFAAIDAQGLIGEIIIVAQAMIRKYGLDKAGYKIIVNGGGAQIVSHLHFHIIGPMGKAVAV